MAGVEGMHDHAVSVPIVSFGQADAAAGPADSLPRVTEALSGLFPDARCHVVVPGGNGWSVVGPGHAPEDARLAATAIHEAQHIAAGGSPDGRGEAGPAAVPLRARTGELLGVLVVFGVRPSPLGDRFTEIAADLAAAFLEQHRENSRRLARMAAARDRAMATLAHELRNSAATVRAGVQLAQQRIATGAPGVDRALAAVRCELDAEVRLLSDLLDLSRGAGRPDRPFKRRRFDCGALAAETVAAFEGLAARADVCLVGQAGPGPLWVRGDPDRLRRVLVNLLDNAVKFTPSGGQVCVAWGTNGRQAWIRVMDDGQGIDAADLPRIFDLYYQGGALSGASPAGVGIGLALCKQLVEAHGGRMAVDSPGRGRGAAFTVTLPLLPALRRNLRPAVKLSEVNY